MWQSHQRLRRQRLAAHYTLPALGSCHSLLLQARTAQRGTSALIGLLRACTLGFNSRTRLRFERACIGGSRSREERPNGVRCKKMKEEVIVETFSQIQRSSREPQDVNFSGGVHQRAPPASRERQHACELGRQFSGGAAASWSQRSSSGGGRLGLWANHQKFERGKDSWRTR
jgi:hypothetical protein